MHTPRINDKPRRWTPYLYQPSLILVGSDHHVARQFHQLSKACVSGYRNSCCVMGCNGSRYTRACTALLIPKIRHASMSPPGSSHPVDLCAVKGGDGW
ncbi:hypothetical protein BV25DRAFT_808739 [Artomyces pyxidatus]|uniref:Uncharacterized protein n=1 Tax=Artomyces pyxidatus TaxID=48021 RepID=A0ACB8SZD7_9AGAM|nr:hypothetical protein BV25DRAFT_808739 [Artomyces pyxidatus]